MTYDLDLVEELCNELGLPAKRQSAFELTITPEDGPALILVNDEETDDCLIGFDGTGWHSHGDLRFCGPRGYYVELNILDVVSGLHEGKLLLCEQWVDGTVRDRWLIHGDYNDEFRWLEPGEELRIRRFGSRKPKASE